MEALNDTHRWVQTKLYEELTATPSWTLAAFGLLNSGDKLKKGDPRLELIHHLVGEYMRDWNCPYNVDYQNSYKISDFLEIIKSAVDACRVASR